MDITKDTLQHHNIPYIDTMENDTAQHIINQLRAIQPDFVDTTGAVNINAISQAVSKDNITPPIQGYSLHFAGKSIANHNADPTTRTKKLQFVPEQSKNADNTENIIIRGDNEQVLKILSQNYHQKIKMIYIDPPYNTGSDGFTYKDNFTQSKNDLIEKFNLTEENINYLENVYSTQNHNGWLAFMYTRLKLARNLLTDDGVIFISIDDNEQANLKLLCDEIFGENNFVACITWANKEGGGSSDSQHFRIKHEYCLIYGKNKEKLTIHPQPVEDTDRYKLSDEHEHIRGKYQLIKLDSASIQYSKSLDYPIKTPDESFAYPKGCWRWSQQKLQWGFENDLVVIKKDKNDNWAVYTKQYLNCDKDLNIIPRTIQPMGIINNWSTTQSNKAIKNLFDKTVVFKYSKPTEYIKYYINLATNPNDIILDFFAGSGTTAHAVMDLNAQDNGNRKFILVQIDEHIDEKKSKTAYDFCTENNFKPVISSITIERINRAGDNLKNLNTLDIGYKVFKTTDKDDLIPDENGNVQYALPNNQDPTDILYNMMCETAVPLHTPIKSIIENKLYMVNDAVYIVGKIDISTLTPYTKNQIYVYHRSKLSLQDYLNIQQTHDYFKAIWG